MDFAEILVVDDEVDICKALRRELRLKVAAVHTAENAEQALAMLDKRHIDLIITDYRMPMMTGTEFLLEAKKRHPEVPAVMLSGQADLGGVTAAVNAGVLSRFVDKPWDVGKLASAIKDTLHAHDPSKDLMTQMATRRDLDRRLAVLPEKAESQCPWLLVVVDIVSLAEYNSVHGKPSGNVVIQKMAAAIRQKTENDWYRVGGKFISFVEYSAKGYQTIDALTKCIDEACVSSPNKVAMRCYVGEAKFWHDWSEQRMTDCKSSALQVSDNLYWMVQEDDHAVGEEFKELGTLIYDLKQGRVEAFFQPQLTLRTGEIEHCEALVRRRLPNNRYQSPIEFLHLIEKYELDDLLTVVMMKHAVDMLHRVGKVGQLKVSVNVTAKQLITGFTLELLRSIEQESAVSIRDIELEVVESDQIFDYQRALIQYRLLHELGVTIAMDDFGTGYAGFESLCELPFDVVKVDGRFIRSLGNSHSDDVILSSIINSAKSLNMEVVAEWVEKHQQMEHLKQIGCTRIQGYLVSPPLPQDEFLYFLDHRVSGVEL